MRKLLSVVYVVLAMAALFATAGSAISKAAWLLQNTKTLQANSEGWVNQLLTMLAFAIVAVGCTWLLAHAFRYAKRQLDT